MRRRDGVAKIVRMPTTAPTALITGSNRGIGLATARELGKRGYVVWLACRDDSSGQAAAADLRAEGIEAKSVVLDVASDTSAQDAANLVNDEILALDVLINNAGMNFGPFGVATEEDLSQMRAMFETNALGPLKVARAFLPLMRRSASPRIVMVTSGLGSLGRTLDMRAENWNVPFTGYSASKTALNMMTLKLARELLHDGFKVNLVDPGLTDTPLGGPAATRSTAEGAAAVISVALDDRPSAPTGEWFVAESTDGLARLPW